MPTANRIIKLSGFRLGQEQKEEFFKVLPHIYYDVKGEYPRNSGFRDEIKAKHKRKGKKTRRQLKSRFINIYDQEFFDAYQSELFGMIQVLAEKTELIEGFEYDELDDEEVELDLFNEKCDELTERYSDLRDQIVFGQEED
ncbi:MAG: hypothetical protein F6K65_33530 [Moorea sp. SIO3C2]|nr:hypothetical protein [Moorena sp. SIO3C2]